MAVSTNILGQMEAFIAVVEAGSFAEAARTLGLSRSSVSRQISALEESLTTTLLVRTTRQLHLTDAGAVYLRRCQQVVRLAEDAITEARTARGELAGSLRITAPMISHRFLMPVVQSFLRNNQRISIDLVFNDEYTDLVAEGFDLALRVGPTKNSTLRSRKLWSVVYGVCASPSYMARCGTPGHPSELAEHEWVALTALADPTLWTFSSGDERVRVRVQSHLAVNTAAALRDALMCGAGISVFPLSYLQDEMRSGALEQVLEDWTLPDSGLYVLYPEQDFVPARTRAFIDVLAAAQA